MVTNINNISSLLRQLSENKPSAFARVEGSSNYPLIRGEVYFYQMNFGVYVVFSFSGLPFDGENCSGNILAMHIHNGSGCSGNKDDVFADAGTHYNPKGCRHPFHAGDLTPVFANDGYGFGAMFTHRFNVDEVVGLPVVLHIGTDDFRTQPSGDSGEKIACGIITKL